MKIAVRDAEWFRLHPEQVKGGDSENWIAASGVRNVESITVPLVIGEAAEVPAKYTVRLHFIASDDAQGKSVFDISLQDETVVKDFDVAKEANESRYSVVKEFTGIEVDKELKIDLKPTAGTPSICGVELVAE